MKINNKQQTAVEWLAEQMEILHYDYWAEHISKDEKNQRLKQLKEQAKEMGKDQHIKSWENGLMKVDFNEYYNETYGDDKQ
jgi:hypothetical protein